MGKRATGEVIYGAKRGVGETRGLIERYMKQGLSIREIARLVGTSTQSVYQHLHSIEATAKRGRRAS